MKGIKSKILEVLKEKGLEERKLERVRDISSFPELKATILKEQWLTEEEFLKILSEVLNIEFVNLSDIKIEEGVHDVVSKEMIFRYKILPLKIENNTLVVATDNPFNLQMLDDLRIYTKKDIKFVLSTSVQIQEFIEKLYEKQQVQLSDILSQMSKGDSKVEIMEVEELDVFSALKESQKAPIVKVVDLILYEALRKRASDIHIEPKENALKIRYRIDGALHEVYNFSKKHQNAIIARLKIMSGMNITESRVPQDGRFKVKFEGREIDFRVSSLPSIFGEKFVLRALDKSNLSIGLDKLGFSSGPLNIFKESLKRPFGMILVTGPTGSGKSTTLYSIIQQLNTPDRNIVTIEDPVEYQIEGITQIQVKPEIGLTFAEGLKALLRQSPDIILVGEIRDSETADIAIKASLTGTLILSTLHTNDSAGAITRLEDMGIEPFLVASSLILATAQRLCRKICPKCKDEYRVSEMVLKRLGIEHLKDRKFYYGKGCQYCNGTGYRGRVPLLECLQVDDKMKEMIIKGASSDEIKEYAIKEKGMKTLRDDALDKCLSGVTTLEEVVRVTAED